MPLPRVFLTWDSTIGSHDAAKAVGPTKNHLRALRESWEDRANLIIPCLDDDQGNLLARIHAALAGAGPDDRAAGAIALLDLPNANVGFEIGLALGLGVPVALVAMQSPAKGWLDHAPTVGHLVTDEGFQATRLDALIEQALDGVHTDWNRAPHPPEPDPAGPTCVLWPENHAGKLYRRGIDKVATLPANPTGSLADLHRAFHGKRGLVWVVPQPVNEPRDGVENARLAIWAGFAHAHDIPTTILTEEPEDGAGRHVVDIRAHRTPFKTPQQLRDQVLALLEPPRPRQDPPTAADPLAPWFTYLRERHDHLIPFCDHLPKSTLRLVHVPLQLAAAERAFDDDNRTPDDVGPRTDAHHRADGTLDATLHLATRAFTHTDRTLEALLRAAPTPLRLIVAADPGGGKTTTARHLVHTLAATHAENPASTEPIPVYLSLAAWSAGLDPFAEVERADGQPGVAARLRNERRPVWLLLDGLDEVGGGRRTQLVAAIEAFAKANPAVAVVVLSRQEGLRGHFEAKASHAWHRAALEGLSLTQRNELLTRLVPDETHRTEITRQIDALPRLAEIAKNPLMLTLTAVVGRDALAQGGRVPTSRPALYEQAVSVLLHGKHRDPPRRVRDPGTAADALGVIAYVLHERGEESWDETTANRAIRDAWDVDDKVFRDVARFWGSADRGDGTPQDLADDLRDNAGLFGTFDGDGRWRFRHRTLKEYLVARTVDRLGKASEFLRTWEAEPKSKDTGGRRSDEIVALLTAIRPNDTAHLAAMAKRAPAALVRLLTTTEGLDPDVVLDLLFRIENEDTWDEDQIVAALLSAKGAVDDLCAALWRRVKPQCDERTCCMLYGALARIPAGGDLRATLTIPWFRVRFFDQLGIALPDPAKIRVEFVPRGTPHQPPVPGPVILRAIELDGGTFRMGSLDGAGADDEPPAHDVSVGPFALGQTLVTRAAWAVFEAARTNRADSNHSARSGPASAEAQLPVIRATWWDAALFAAWLGARLPAEAEWEHACRAGTTSNWSHGDDEEGFERYAHFGGGAVQPVATRQPNPWGLYDVHGNAYEWCADGPRTYPVALAEAPLGPRNGLRVIRGGSVRVSADWCRSACRVGVRARIDWNDLGVRVLFPPPARDP